MLLFALVLVTQNATADEENPAAPDYCSGQILDVLVRSNGDICVKHSGSGSEWICVDPNIDDAIKSRLLSVVVTGYVSGKSVELKFESGVCSMMPTWAHFEYAMLMR